MSVKKLYLYIIACLLTIGLPISASGLKVRDFTFSHFGTLEGLSSQRVYSLHKSKDNAVDKSKVRDYLKLKEQEIRQGIASPGDGYDEEFKGIQLKKQGRDEEALVQFYIAIGKHFMAPALYTETAKLLHKYKMYEEELSVLEAELKYSVLNTNKKDEVEKRKEKLKQLISEE